MEIKTLEDLFDAGGLTNEHIRETGDSNPVAWEYFRTEALKQFIEHNHDSNNGRVYYTYHQGNTSKDE